jgi:site-specific DNA recombinase
LAQIYRRIEDDGCTIPSDACFLDNGSSGATLTRPALERLRTQVAQGMIDRLYIVTPDLLARRCAHILLLLDEFTQGGVELVVLNGSLPADEPLLEIKS